MKIRKRTFNKFGHVWRWYGYHKKDNLREHWKSTAGKLVRIYPPSKTWEPWDVFVPSFKNSLSERYIFTGKNVRERAFAVAEVLARQNRT